MLLSGTPVAIGQVTPLVRTMKFMLAAIQYPVERDLQGCDVGSLGLVEGKAGGHARVPGTQLTPYRQLTMCQHNKDSLITEKVIHYF